MSVRTFLRLGGILLAAICAWSIYFLFHQWNEQQIGSFTVRQNAITGIVQIWTNGDWKVPFENDQYAAALAPEDFKRIQFMDIAWGQSGLLCARALVSPGPAIKGRLAFRLDIIDMSWKKHIRQRELRETVNFPGGALTPFVLRTGLSAPAEKNQKTFITLQPTLYSGE